MSELKSRYKLVIRIGYVMLCIDPDTNNLLVWAEEALLGVTAIIISLIIINS